MSEMGQADVLRLVVLCRGDPNATKYCEHTGHQLASDRLAKQIRCKQCGRDWLNRDRGRYASWRCSLQRYRPKNKSKRAAAHPEVHSGEPLWQAKCGEDLDYIWRPLQ